MAGRASCLWGPSLPQRLQEVVTCVSEAVMDAGSSDRCPAHPSPLLTPCPTVSPQVPPARAGGWPLWRPHPFSSPQEGLPCGSGELCMGSLSPRRTHTHTQTLPPVPPPGLPKRGALPAPQDCGLRRPGGHMGPGRRPRAGPQVHRVAGQFARRGGSRGAPGQTRGLHSPAVVVDTASALPCRLPEPRGRAQGWTPRHRWPQGRRTWF